MEGSAVVEKGPMRVEEGFQVDVKPAINPPVKEVRVESEETGEGLRVSFDVVGEKGLKGSTWRGAVDLTVYRATSFGDREVVTKEIDLKGGKGSTIVKNGELGGDGDYVAEVSLGDAAGEAFTRVKGKDGKYDPESGSTFMAAALAGLLGLTGFFLCGEREEGCSVRFRRVRRGFLEGMDEQPCACLRSRGWMLACCPWSFRVHG